MYDNHRKEEHLIASDINTRNLWIEGLQYLMDRHAQETQGRLIREEKSEKREIFINMCDVF
jgi:hypothetical protein